MSQPTIQPPVPTDSVDDEAANGAKRWFMRGVITATVVLCIAMVAVLFRGWVTVDEPNSMVAIVGGKELAGATVFAETVARKPYEIRLNENGNGRFFPQSGRYRLRVFYGESDEVFFKDPIHVEIEPETLQRITLERAVATTRPWLRP